MRVSRKGTICFWGICLILGIGAGFLRTWMGNNFPKDRVEKWELEQSIVYDKERKEQLDELQDAEINFVFWEKSSGEIENADFCRTKRVDIYGIVGNTSVLFPNANALCYGETGYCILSKDVAVELFGSVHVVGRNVLLQEKPYMIAGIETKVQNLCAYELSPKDSEKVSNVGCSAKDKTELWQVKQIVSKVVPLRE